MDFLKIPLFIYLTLLSTHIVAQNITNDPQLAQIAELEKEQSSLYKQINDAIDDSVLNLQQTNDSDARIGIQYITELKKQVEELNGTLDDVGNDKEARRSIYTKFEGHARKKKTEDKIFIDKLFRDKDLTEKKKKLYQNREAMQKRIEAWMQKRLEEKNKIKKYEQGKLQFIKESCPRFGSKNRKRSRKRKYTGTRPCCRKCCKRSYLGCL